MIRTLLVLALVSSDLNADEQTAADSSQRDVAIDGVLAWMSAYRNLPNISIWIDVEYEPLKGRAVYAFSPIRIETRRQGEKLRTIPELTNRETKELERRDTTWDGKFGYSRNISADPVPRVLTIFPRIHSWTLSYRLFDDFIFSPEGEAHWREHDSNVRRDESDYWLPFALKRNRADFTVDDDREVVSGQNCVVLTRGRFDRFCVAPELSYAICQRQVLIEPMLLDREVTTASDFKKINGLWLPHKIVREVWIPGDEPEQWVARDRRTMVVKMISTALIDESEFRLPIPEGVQLFDYRDRAATP